MRERARRCDVEAAIQPILARLRAIAGVTRVEMAGSLRRRCESVGDVDLVIALAGHQPSTRYAVYELIHAEEPLGLVVDARMALENAFGALLLHATGSQAHNVYMRSVAYDQHKILNAQGLFDARGACQLLTTDELGIFEHLGLSYVEPERR